LTLFVPILDRKIFLTSKENIPFYLLYYSLKAGVVFSKIHGKIKELDIKRRGK
jgi:hypothetical protein